MRTKCPWLSWILCHAQKAILVIPKDGTRGLLDVPTNTLAELIKRVQHVARAVKDALTADGITLHQFTESAGGQVIFHLHFHILPRWEGVALSPPGAMADDAILAAQAEKIKAAMMPFNA